jgi:hypothetical protein
MKKQKLFMVALSIFLVMALSISNVSAVGLSDTLSDVSSDSSGQQVFGNDKSNSSSGKDISKLTPENIPEDLLKSADLESRESIVLDTDDSENPNSFTLVNEDESKTVFVYEQPIKYEDKSTGEIRFIDNTLKQPGLIKGPFDSYAYTNTANEFETSFPKHLQTGVLIEDETYSFSVRPVTEENATAQYKEFEFLNSEQKVVEYPNAFGNGAHLQYAPTTSGLKENILLESYNESIDSFQFIITVPGLVPDREIGEFIQFLDESTSEPIYTIESTYIQDSFAGTLDTETDEIKHISFDNYYTIENFGDGEYLLTTVLDSDFLASETTIYPVLIDPTIARESIFSASVFSGTGTRVIGTWNTVGNLSGYGQGRSYVKATAIQNYKYINPDKISSAYYRAQERSGNGHSATVQIWDTFFTTPVGSVTYSQCLNNLDGSTPISSTGISSSATTYDFNITSLVKAWLRSALGDGGYTQDYGFVMALANGGSVIYKQFGSNSNSTYPPSIIINYSEDTSLANGTYHIKNVWTGKYLNVSNPAVNGGSSIVDAIVWSFGGHGNDQWRVVSQGGGMYKLYSMWPFPNNGLKCLDVTGDNIDVYTDGSGEYLLFTIIKNSDGTYRLMSKYYNNYTKALDVNGNSSSSGYQKDVISYEYSGGSNQRWIFSNVSFGSGGSYRTVGAGSPASPDCMGYSLTTAKPSLAQTNVGLRLTGNSYYTNDHLNDIDAALGTHVSYRRLENYASALQSGEYRVAIRTPNGYNGWRFHIIYQLSNGTWVGKNYEYASKQFPNSYSVSNPFKNVNPSNSPDMWDGDSIFPAQFGTAYYAVKPK